MTLWLAVVVGTAALVALLAFSQRVLPYNMDEFVHYHALGCATAPLGQDLPSFRDGCGLYELRLPGTGLWLPLRSYYYIGSFPAAVYLPFWLVIDDPVAARIQGGLFFVLFVLLASRLLQVRPIRVLLASLVFPVFVVSFVADQGPVGLSVLLLLAALLAVRRALSEETPGRGAAWAALAGGAVFLGLWVKLIFGWWLPGLALYALAEVRRRGGTLKEALPRLAPLALAAGLALLAPLAVLLASHDVDGRPYGAALSRGRISLDTAQVVDGSSLLGRYLVDASLVSPRNVTLPGSRLDLVPALVAALVLAAALASSRPRRREVGGWFSLALLTFAVATTSAFTQWPHHFVFPAVFGVLALAVALESLGKGPRVLVTLVVLTVWVSVGVRWPSATFPRDSSPGKDELLSFVRQRGLDREMFQVHSSWGTYYIAQLFGAPERLAVFVKGIPDDAVQLRQVACLARDHGRPLLLVSSREWPRMQTSHVDEILGRPSRTWRFDDWWAIAYETEGVHCAADGAAGP